MSKITNPNTEPSVSCGFFNSNYDRYYDAAQMSQIFDGIINDGVFATIGDALVVNAETGNTVKVGTGKCWFNHTWTENDAILPVECEISEVLLDRIDAIIVEVNNNEEVRDNFIKFIKGTPSSSPVRPTLEDSHNVCQRALCYIYRPAGSTEIRQADITNMVGTDETPFVTGLLDVVSLDKLLGKWQDELDQFVTSQEEELDRFVTTQEDGIEQFIIQQEEEFNVWFNKIQGQLTEDVTGGLLQQIDNINNKLSNVLYIESFDESTGILITKSADYTG